MKAITYRKYGPPGVVQLADVPKPAPKPNEVLVRIHATTVSTADWRARSLQLPPGMGLVGRLVFGILRPRQPILGTELSGVVEEVGAQVTKFRKGDAVFAFFGSSYGCHAEFRCAPEDALLVLKPANLSFEEAAAMSFGGTTALDFLRDKGNIKAGEKVLINGASGSVGTAAVQIAKHFGAHVTGVCSAGNRELVLSLGADRVVDYRSEDFTKIGETYDIILNNNSQLTYAKCRDVLNPGGRLLLVLGSLTQMMMMAFPNRSGGRKVIAGVAAERVEDMQFLAKLAEAGEYRPVIDRVWPLEQAAEAHAHVDKGHKKGNVVLSVGNAVSG